jgi:hypothetical protein
MKTCRKFLVVIALTAAAGWAADRIVVYKVQLAGPMGTDRGHIITSGDNLIFVNDVDGTSSFTIPKSDIKSLKLENGVITMMLARPFSNIYDSRSDVVMQFGDSSSPQTIATWVGLPLTGMTVERSRVAVGPTAVQYNVRHEGDDGRLIVGSDSIEWQNLKNTSKSRTWRYSEIKRFKREGDNKLELVPHSGSDFTFKIEGEAMTDEVYNAIADGIVAAHR